jgi:hypothetical protein
MGVIIHEFEVVAEPQSGTQPVRTSQSEKESQSLTSSHAVELILRHQMERLARVWAH